MHTHHAFLACPAFNRAGERIDAGHLRGDGNLAGDAVSRSYDDRLRALAAQIMDASIGWESVSNFHEDRKEAVAAMREKRAPKLTGE